MQNPRFRAGIAVSAMLLSCSAHLLDAASVGLNFVSSRNASAAMAAGDSAGFASVAQGNWNNTPTNANGSISNLKDDSGVGTTVGVTWAAQGTWTTNNGTANGHSKLFNGYLDAIGSGGFVTIDISGIPYAQYDVYVYFGSDGNGRTGAIADTTPGGSGLAYGYTTDANQGGFAPGDYVQSTDTGGGNPQSTYCVFTENNGASFSLRVNRGSNNSGVFGVQVVETTPLPGLPEVETLAASGLSPGSATANGNLIDNGEGAASTSLTIYWGQSDGGTDPAAWGASAPAGARTSPGAFSAALGGLAPNTTYHYRAFASNAVGDDWAPAGESFTTPASLPQVQNVAASDVFASSAAVGAEVLSTGGDEPQVVIYYGDEDGGSDFGSWDHMVDLGDRPAGPVSTGLTLLQPSTTYHFRAVAGNSAGVAWAPEAASFTTPAIALPAVSNAPATGVNGTFATLNGSVTDSGGEPPTVAIYYGTSDGGSDTNAWDAAVGLGTRTGGFSTVVSSLQPETIYFFRARATNLAGSAWASPSLTFTTPVFVAPSVVINEIHFDEDDKTERAEFIELHNPSESAVDLAGYYFSNGIDFEFPANSMLPAGGYAVIAEDPATMLSKFGVAGAYGPFLSGTTLKNSGETITLRDPGGTKVDEVDYSLGFPWPTVGDDVGSPAASPSIELINPLLDNDLGGSWRASGFPVTSAVGGGGPVDFVQSGDVWEYLDDGSDQGATNWKTDAANSAGWESGPSQLGYNEGDEATLVGDGDGNPTQSPRAITTYFRKVVEIAGVNGFTSMRFGLLRDDGAVVYVNGVEAFRDNMPAGAITYTTPASGSVGGGNEDLFFEHNVSPGLFVEGTNVIAVEIHQSGTGSSDISFDLELTGEVGAFEGNNTPTPGATNRSFSNNAPPQMRQLDLAPVGRVLERDKTILPGEEVLITAKITDPEGVAAVALEYQVVEPGDYIKDDDARYSTQWTSVPMVDDGGAGDEVAADARFSVVLPAALQTHRRLVRYRIVATDGAGLSVRAPYADDAGLNFAYFVYGSVPNWNGGGTTFDFSQMEPVPVYHLVTTREDHEDSQWIPNATGGSYGGSDYRWGGALVYDGKVYDHIRFRARGGVWRYAMGKNMWKFDFNRGRRFQARDDYGRKYDTTWDKLNFSALIQQGNFLQRGEQGLFEGAGFKLHNLTGNQASKTNYVHFRIIEHADETGPTGSQFDDDFQGLYMAIEQLDGQFLDEHDLPDGNFYKMEGGSGTLNNQGPTQPSNRSDLNAFLGAFDGAATSPQSWWEDNLWLDDYYNFYACVTAIHDNDIHANKNYFFYHRPVDPLDPQGDKWQVINWDLDLCWTTTYRLNNPPNDRLDQDVFAIPTFARDYRNRMREIRDLLFNPEQTGLLLDEIAQFVYTPGQTSFVDADKTMWDTNPILTSGYINSSKAGHNRYWQAVSPRNFGNMIQHVKNYVATRSNYIDNTVLTDDNQVPATPTITYSGASGFPVNELSFTSSAYSSPSGSAFAAMEWRLAEITPPAMLNKLEPPKYEIEAVWESGELSNFSGAIDCPGVVARPGRSYRARVRHKDAAGRWGHWSAPMQFVASSPDLTPFVDGLRLTELHYHPAEATPGEGAMGWTTSDFEFVELLNVGDADVDLTDVRFTKGIDFDFPAGTTVAPGAYVLVVRNRAAFESRYGDGLPISGEWDPSNKLSNAGENLKLSFGAGISIIEFTYSDDSPWPTEPDGGGYSLTLDCPEESQPADHADPLAWRASRMPGGTPGAGDGIDFATWATSVGLAPGAPWGDDPDGDGLNHLLEYALASDPLVASAESTPAAAVQLLTVAGDTDFYLTLTFRRQVGAKDLIYSVEFSEDLGSWDVLSGERFASIPNGDGTATEVWRSPVPVTELTRYFIRLRVEG